MTLLRFEPFKNFERINRKMHHFANELEKGISFEMGGFTPRVDITEDEKHVYIHAEFPGMQKEDIKISVNEEKMMTISGNKNRPEKSEENNYVRNERIYGEFKRSFMLAENIDIEKIDANYSNGVLNLKMNKIEPQQPKEINVEIK